MLNKTIHVYPFKKIKPIPRKTSSYVPTPKDLNMLIKKGTKVKNLKIPNEDDESSFLKIASFNKWAKYCKSLYGLQISCSNTQNLVPILKDLDLLLKIQCKARYIQSLQLDRTDLENLEVCERLKSLLVRFKHLRNYKSESDQVLAYMNHLNEFEEEKIIRFAFHSKKNIYQNDYQKTQKFIFAMRNRLYSLDSVEESETSFKFVVNILFDNNEFCSKILGLISRFHRHYPLDYITLPSCLQGTTLHSILPFVEANRLNIISQINFDYLLNNKEIFERFFLKKDAIVILDSSTRYSWETFFAMLDLSREIISIHGPVIRFTDFHFDFHASMEVKKKLIHYFKLECFKWERIVFSFKANSLDWFEEAERSCLKVMINEACKEENANRYSEIQWNMHFTTAFENELATKAKDEIFWMIQYLVKSQQKANILKKQTLIIDFGGWNDQNLLSFLALFQQIPNAIHSLELNLKTFRAEKIQDNLVELKENSAFKNFVIPQIDEFIDPKVDSQSWEEQEEHYFPTREVYAEIQIEEHRDDHLPTRFNPFDDYRSDLFAPQWSLDDYSSNLFAPQWRFDK